MAAMGQDGLRGLSAITCRCLLRLNWSRRAEPNGRFSASNLKVGISQTGQLLPFNYSGKRPFERPLYFGSGQMANSHTSAFADLEPLASVGQQWCGYQPFGGQSNWTSTLPFRSNSASW